jgi:tRNA(Ile)-lysidine synthase
MSELEKIIQATVAEHEMLPEESASVILMVSGGSDSVALARLLPALYPQHDYTILHVNHHLRGEESDADERFVVALAAELGLPCEVAHLDLSGSGNVEQAAREGRYAAARALLIRTSKQDAFQVGTPGSGRAMHAPTAMARIVTAHTCDDRIETFLMRVIKGGGAGSLASIPYVNAEIIRPLLDCTREQLQDWSSAANDKQLLWREDATNADTAYLRAFVRHEVIPQLKARNPRLEETLARSLDLLGEEDAFLAKQAAELTERYLVVDRIPPQPIATISTALFAHDPVLVRRVIRLACLEVMPSGARLTSEHIRHIANGGARVGFATDIPGDVTVRNVYDTLIVRQKTAGEQPNRGTSANRFSPQEQ